MGAAREGCRFRCDGQGDSGAGWGRGLISWLLITAIIRSNPFSWNIAVVVPVDDLADLDDVPVEFFRKLGM